MHRKKSSIKGGALLTALFIMTLVAIVATAMTVRLQLDIYRTRLIITHDKLYLASQAVTFWTLDELSNKKNNFAKADSSGRVAQFPRNLETLYPQIQVSGAIYDLQSRYNLNNQIDKRAIISFVNLQKNTLSQTNEVENRNRALALYDWLSPYNINRGKDNYTTYYLSQKPPYFPSHQLMQSSSELRLVKEISGSNYLALEPFIIALPETTAINLNTAPKQVLETLGNGLRDEQINKIILARGENGIKKMSDISELLKKLNLSSGQVSIESQYFLSIAHAKNEEFNLTVYTLYKRSRNNKRKIAVSIIRESINGF